jgi:hypothetical protein
MRLYPWFVRLAVVGALIVAAATGGGWKWTALPPHYH